MAEINIAILKQDSWWATELILESEENIQLKLPHSTER
jgi:hypothetical protein